MKKILLSIALSLLLFAEGVVVPDDYFISEDSELSYIYSWEYKQILPKIKEYQQDVIEQYKDEFGFELDDRLYVGLASQNNQIANGFSTQMPFNSQLFYGAGAGGIDYFCYNSWLKTLIIHETAHNFQLNPRENAISWLGHKVFGNTPISFLTLFPVFPIPNLLESSFIIEGNAVMNESRFGNGGRLYSGYALAEVVSLAMDNKIRAELIYNDTLQFPYTEKFYLVGGFFQQFLAQKYGVQKVNRYFKEYSKQIFPFFTNSIFKELFGKTLETLLAEFVTELKAKHSNFKTTNGKSVAKSQVFVPMNRFDDNGSDNEIYTLISDLKSSPKMLVFNKKSKKITFEHGNWKIGEPFKVGKKYYTQGSTKVSSTKIKMGLLDSNSYLKDETESKILQGYMPDKRAVYFDVEKSIETPQIYIDNKFYDQSSSSVYVSQDGNLYYFKQNGKSRTLYKNKKAIFSYSGHYGFVADIGSDGTIYFVANSEHGSSVYCYNKGKIERVLEGDDVIEFKLIDSSTALVATIGSSQYSYKIADIMPNSLESETLVLNKTRLKPSIPSFLSDIEDKKSKITKNNQPFQASKRLLEAEDYHPLTQLKFSSLEQWSGYSSYDGLLFNVRVNFSDALMQNSLSTSLSYDETRTIGGLSYYNQAHQLEFGGAIYGVSYSNKYVNAKDDYGYSLKLKLPFLAKGYWRGSTAFNYTKEYDSIREPLTLSLDISNKKQFGISKYPNHLNSLNLFLSKDRESNIFGATYSWIEDMPWQSFIGVTGSYMRSDSIDYTNQKGIEIDDSWSDIESDYTRVIMPTLNERLYAEEIKTAEFSLSKVIDTPLYFFSFPLSLHRETLYVKEKFYDIELENENREYIESTFGIESDILFLNKLTLPIKVEWIYNKDVKDDLLFRVIIGGEF